MSICPHHNKVGDNYGITCMDCNAQIAGMGHWGEFPSCLHEWLKEESSPEIEYCAWCGLERKAINE